MSFEEEPEICVVIYSDRPLDVISNRYIELSIVCRENFRKVAEDIEKDVDELVKKAGKLAIDEIELIRVVTATAGYYGFGTRVVAEFEEYKSVVEITLR